MEVHIVSVYNPNNNTTYNDSAYLNVEDAKSRRLKLMASIGGLTVIRFETMEVK